MKYLICYNGVYFVIVANLCGLYTLPNSSVRRLCSDNVTKLTIEHST